MRKVELSVIIPIHNGSKYIKSLYKNIYKQTFRNIEIILVENFSKDNSLTLCNEIARIDSRVIVLESKKPGTSLARKRGVEHATGEYIVFMDQDDKYIHNHAIEDMYNTIKETGASICQFSSYGTYGFGINKKTQIIDSRKMISAKEVREKVIGDIYAYSNEVGIINAAVWTKIYKTEVLKDAVQKVEFPLYFAEDQFLIICCMLSNILKNVCVDPQAFYVWDKRFGFSGSRDSGKALMKDFEQIKPVIHKMLTDAGAGEEVFY